MPSWSQMDDPVASGFGSAGRTGNSRLASSGKSRGIGAGIISLLVGFVSGRYMGLGGDTFEVRSLGGAIGSDRGGRGAFEPSAVG